MRLQWTPAAMHSAQRAVRDDPTLRSRLQDALARLTADPYDPKPHTHKLKGPLADRWAASVDFDNRIVFRFEDDRDLVSGASFCSPSVHTTRCTDPGLTESWQHTLRKDTRLGCYY